MTDSQECPYDGIDLLSTDFAERFEDITQDMLKRSPLPRTAAGWLITRYEDVHPAANDWKLFSSGANGINPWRPENFWLLKPLEADPPLHGQVRKPLQPLFAPGPTAAREAAIREIAQNLLVQARKAGRFEVCRVLANERGVRG